jgi:hypothetical protein
MSVPLLVRPITGFQPPFRSILYYPHQSVDLKNSPDSKRRFAPARSSRIFGKGLPGDGRAYPRLPISMAEFRNLAALRKALAQALF